jgi:integrase
MITIRYRKLASGKYSVFLDCFDETTKERKYEFLKKYVTWDYSQKQAITLDDKETMQSIFTSVDERNKKHTLSDSTEIVNKITSILAFIEYLHKKDIATYTVTLYKYLKIYNPTGKDIPFTKIDEEWIQRFIDYCKQNYSRSQATILHSQLHLIIKKAIENGLTVNGLSVNGNILTTKTVDGLKQLTVSHAPRQEPNYLSNDEIKLLEDSTVVPNVSVRDAFLFSYYTGLHWKDVKELTWGKIQLTVNRSQSVNRLETVNESESVNGKTVYSLILLHLKSEDSYTIELNTKAIAILLQYSNDKNNLSNNNKEALVFDKLPNKPNTFLKLRLWGYQAGLKQDLCFSMARDSFMMQSISQNKSINTICKDLGIRNKDRVKFISEKYKSYDNTTI